MKRDSMKFQRRPFLIPIWLTAIAAAMVFSFVIFAAWMWVTAGSTIVVVIRHAEKELGSGVDPALTAAGTARADLLARMFGDRKAPGHIDAIYVSPTLRNRMTAAPLAAKLNLAPIVAPPRDARSLARRVLHEHRGGRVLIVGHSDTVIGIVESLTGAKRLPAIREDEYDTMYVVTVPSIGRADFLRVTY